MKTSLIKVALIMFIFIGASHSASAQVFVKIRPVVPVVVQTPAPSPRHVWIREEWEPNGTEYRYVGGHWAEPREGYRWKEGHWRHENRGDVWVAGKWRGHRR